MKPAFIVALFLLLTTARAEESSNIPTPPEVFPSVWSTSDGLQTTDISPDASIVQTKCGYDLDAQGNYQLDKPCSTVITVESDSPSGNKCKITLDNLIINFNAGSTSKLSWTLKSKNNEFIFKDGSISIETGYLNAGALPTGQPLRNNDNEITWQRQTSSLKSPKAAYLYNIKIYKKTITDSTPCGVVDPLIISHG